jgi:hypothetical protein
MNTSACWFEITVLFIRLLYSLFRSVYIGKYSPFPFPLGMEKISVDGTYFGGKMLKGGRAG